MPTGTIRPTSWFDKLTMRSLGPGVVGVSFDASP